mgnify:FL=1|tara:strand:+ start:139 stop:588 length:450 start_codon:yes stop_codon:yes gene_type:complete
MPQTFTAYRAGGRSRTVQNIATDAVGVPQPEQIAYTITEATSAPTADTDGYKNIGLQKTLHCLMKNNATGGNVTIQLWGYHAAFDEWGILTVLDVTDGSGSAIAITAPNNTDLYNIFNIEGIERIAVRCTDYNNSATGNVHVYLGVNSI